MEKSFFLAEDFVDKCQTIYEAVTIIARRARKIAADHKIELDRSQSLTEVEAESEEEQTNDEMPRFNFQKPTMIAMRELNNQELDFDYKK